MSSVCPFVPVIADLKPPRKTTPGSLPGRLLYAIRSPSRGSDLLSDMHLTKLRPDPIATDRSCNVAQCNPSASLRRQRGGRYAMLYRGFIRAALIVLLTVAMPVAVQAQAVPDRAPTTS